ncbi:MAG TPA: hypothetical protein PK417_05885 [Hyphomonas sp.]|nr:hypothetical protein [Hyphomonas sp.]HRX73916.1 hypothetical protein [Hyphomonas sp.]
MHYGQIISCVALGAGAAMGLGALLSPRWASGVVRLVADPNPSRPGGYSEFRATYGGLFLMTHLAALLIAVRLPAIYAAFAAMPLALGWIGAGLGRLVSLLADRTGNRAAGLIPVWIPLEIFLGLAIGANTLQVVELIRTFTK